jgi:hypothetical protein
MMHYAGNTRLAQLANAAIDAGLGATKLGASAVRAIRHGRCPIDAADELAGRGEIDGGAWATVRRRVVREQARLKRQRAANSRAHRAREREARQAADDRKCPVCGKSMKGQRADALVCSTKCRVRGHRHLGSLKSLALDPNMDRFKGGRTLEQRADLAMACLRMPVDAVELTGKFEKAGRDD